MFLLYALNYISLSFNYVLQIVYYQTRIITSGREELKIRKSRQEEIYFRIHQYCNHLIYNIIIPYWSIRVEVTLPIDLFGPLKAIWN